jgi:ADP-ribose pyrophosphatase YjhB (NUDIX family)
MSDVRKYCCNCAHDASFELAQFPYICAECQTDPYKIKLLQAGQNALELSSRDWIPLTVYRQVMSYLLGLKSKCETNPDPVIIGIILTELYQGGGKVLMIKRAIEPCIGQWALVSGHIIKPLSWQENLRKEVIEEASVTLDMSHMTPFNFESNGRRDQLLNFAVVKPEGVVRINDFNPDHETSDRMEFQFGKYVRPPFCFPIHTEMFDLWCKQHFKW